MEARETKDPTHVDEKMPEKSEYKNADKALEFLRFNGDAEEGTVVAVDEKALVKKIDWMIVPIMFACYFLQYLDKSLLNFAAVMGIREDANLTTEQYGTLSWLFYLAFLIFEIPHAYLMQRLPVAKYLGGCVCAWGTVVTCTAACDSYASLAVCRFLLGAFESAISPSLILVTSMWYKRDEQPKRIGFWYLGVGIAVMVGSLISYGFQHYNGDKFNNWQIMYLVVGLITISAGIVVILFLPDNPMSSRLTHDEKILAVSRLRENNTGIENKTFKPYQFREALTDPQVWLLAFITTAASVPNGAVSSFQSVIISGFGFSNKQTALIQIPGGLITVVSTLIGTYVAGRYNCRGAMLATWAALGGIVGGGMIAFIPASNQAGRLAGNYLTNTTGSFLPLAYAFAACNFAGHTKKVTMNAILLMSFCLGNILGPLTFRNADAPAYTPAKITIVAVEAAVLCGVVVLLVYYRAENRRRDKLGAGSQGDGDGFGDLTDRENKGLRYKF
ncbi:major facilitator superfamily domain-containing protein [Boeremia exigua]|uniref:major facilitator superfamily domain-containing protein n=1 Tax=Boeremia exigua TaxID=749465 RepID=UPI001E8E377B|nr:major facilitator superfamily domain-containing protein [Boeremia exigua]KAH6611808.1 major facilitator superfamily domain-containing protein [Boeremia exigua]